MKEQGRIEAGPGDAASKSKNGREKTQNSQRDKLTLNRGGLGLEMQGHIGADMTNPGQSQSKWVKPVCGKVN
jgi:hypothetical protein